MGDRSRVREISTSKFRTRLIEDPVGIDCVNNLLFFFQKLTNFEIVIDLEPRSQSTDILTVRCSRYNSNNEDISNDP